ncbi:unnamed protein product [Schistocephalus solidus]|uniref:PhoLip_ATPase_N domain-containing protein n=1 Tax=Schistocephalus solidus TaxID=70667 RepID=A0A183THY2_SCHSO|nr:unnamed protein product [Schistocephalus solidus]
MGGLDCSKLHLLSKKSQQERCVVLNHSKINRHSADSVNRQFPKNVAVSSHYTWWNFLVLDIFEQMHSVSNFFFTMISIIFFFGETPISPATVVAPLIVVMSVQIIKDGYDDLGRHLNDKKINDTPFLVWVHKDRGFEVESSWDSVKARNIRCGDLILCREGESFPCDTLLLASSNHDGKVAVTTGNLDGESSVKTRFTLPATQKPFEVLLKEFNSPGTLGSLLGDVNFPSVAHIVCQNPTDDFGTFEGRLEYATANTEGNGTDNQHSIPLTIENIGLRGATLRTSGVICVAIYTGKDTKLSLNAKCGQKKTSSTKHRFNSILLIFILAMLILTLIFVGIEYGWQNQVSGSGWYLVYGQLTAWKVTQGAFDEAILMNYLIPISMIVIMEIVQFFLALYAVNDITFYDEHLGKHCQVNATNIAEELGQVEFLFSDKTGTLTENKMEFRCFALAEENHAYSLEEDGLYKISGKPKQYSNEGVPMGVKEFVDVTFESSEDENEADSFAKQASRHWQRGTEREIEHSEEAELFWKVATLCHSVEVKASSEAEEQKGDNMNYSAASPDELALVRAAAKCGFVYLGRESTTDEWTDLGRETVRVSTLSGAAGGDGRKLLHFYRGGTLEFDSTRRRMSVLVQSAQDGRCFVFSKGAETAILNQRALLHYVVSAEFALGCSLNAITDSQISALQGDFTKVTELSIEPDRHMEFECFKTQSVSSEKLMPFLRMFPYLNSLRFCAGNWVRWSNLDVLLAACPRLEGLYVGTNRVDVKTALKSATAHHVRTLVFNFPEAKVPCDFKGLKSCQKTEYILLRTNCKNKVSSGSPPRIHDNVTRQVNDFASRGLRTLVFAAREVSASLYRTMVDELKRAQGLTGQERIKALEKISAKIESRLSLVGVSGVEDRLQPGVKRCLRSLITAGIQVWVLTGDKEETATKISQTAGLFSRQMTLLRLTQYENVESVARAISDHLKLIQMTPELVLDQAGGNPAPPGSVTTCSTVASVPSEGETSVSLTRVTRTQCAARWLEKLRSWFQQAWTTGHRKGHQQRNGTRTIGLVIDGQTLRYATSVSLYC